MAPTGRSIPAPRVWNRHCNQGHEEVRWHGDRVCWFCKQEVFPTFTELQEMNRRERRKWQKKMKQRG